MGDSDNMKLAVFTSKHVLEDGSLITHVSHDPEGDWQFHSDEDLEESDARIVGLGEIIEMDESVMQVMEMPIGSYATRNNRNAQWQIIKQEDQ